MTTAQLNIHKRLILLVALVAVSGALFVFFILSDLEALINAIVHRDCAKDVQRLSPGQDYNQKVPVHCSYAVRVVP